MSVTAHGLTGTLERGFSYGDADTPEWATLVELLPSPAVIFDPGIRDAIMATGLAWRVRDAVAGVELVLIPPGTFQMGEAGRFEPVHQVTLTNAFYLGRYEVTQAQWTAVTGANPSYFQGSRYPDWPDRPVEQVSWNTIQGFLTATGMRLPTEAEWEYACRGGTTTAFHGWLGNPIGTNDDNQVGNIAWYEGNNVPWGTKTVGQLLGNGFGLHDMCGNVLEWINDWYQPNYYSMSPPTNPPGPTQGWNGYRVCRGAAYAWAANSLRSSHRGYHPPSNTGNVFGLRVARNP